MEKEHKTKITKKKSSSKSNYFVIALVGLLLVFSLVQTYQINAIKSEVAGTGVVTAKVAAPTPQPTQAPPTQAKTAPTMVGGC